VSVCPQGQLKTADLKGDFSLIQEWK